MRSAPTAPRFNRYQSRVSGFPEVMGQMPVVALAEEIETPGDGQIRALVCLAGNPVVSNPDSDRLENALGSLEFMVCIDIYHTETTCYADVILPGVSTFEKGHYDGFLGSMGYRNTARYSAPVFDRTEPDEWDIGITMAYLMKHNQVPSTSDLRAFEDDLVAAAVSGYVNDQQGPLAGRDVQELVALIGPEKGAERLLDLGIRAGAWGDHFGERDGLTLKTLIDTPDGIDFGAIRPGRMDEILATRDGLIDLGPLPILNDLKRLARQQPVSGYQLIGRRNIKTNNSWLRNLPMLQKGKSLCELELALDDAKALGVATGDWVDMSTGSASLRVQVKVSQHIAKGVVSLPHGFSETAVKGQQRLQAGANYNRLVATSNIDALSATAATNGVVVHLSRAAPFS